MTATSLAALVKAYDVRGTVPDQLSAEVAHALGVAFAANVDASEVLVGRDMRPSGPGLVAEFTRGVQSQGLDVIDLGLPVRVAAALLRAGLPPQALVLELVEDTLLTNPQRARDVLTELRELGVRTSIDDYGSGYSSLGYLHRLPADELKLDRSLTAGVHDDPRAAAIVRHTAALAHDLGLSLVAEGVEDLRMARVLARLGCDVAQGFGVARPMPVADFRRWIRAHAAGFDLSADQEPAPAV